MSVRNKNSSNPVERAEAELQELMGEFNELIGAGQGDGDGDGGANADDITPPINSEPTDPPANDPPANDDSYKHKWETLQGIVRSKDTQIATLTAQIEQLTQSVETLMQQVQQGQGQQSAAATGDGAASASNLIGIAASIREQFGDELGNVFEKFAQHIQKLEEGTQFVHKQVAEVKSNLSVNKAEERLTQICHNWRTIDTDPEFIAWLENNRAPYSDKTMMTLLNDNWKAGNIETVGKIFNEFVALKAAQQQQQPPPARDPRAGLVTPGKTGNASPPPAGNVNAKIYTEAQVDKFFRDVQSGLWRGREAEAKQIEDDITLAYFEGRVR